MDDKVEVERKRRLPDGGERLAARLADLGWRADEPVLEVDTYYSRPDVDFMETVECLRVRRRGDFAEVTYKPPSTSANSTAGVISKVETNVALAAADQAPLADRLLEAIGMRLLVLVEKRRTAYLHPDLPDVTVAIDTVAGVGTFVETEVISSDVIAAADLVERVEKELEVVNFPTVGLPYRDLAMSATAI